MSKMPWWPASRGKQQKQRNANSCWHHQAEVRDAKGYWTLSQTFGEECLCAGADYSSFSSANIIAAQNIIKFRNKGYNSRILYSRAGKFISRRIGCFFHLFLLYHGTLAWWKFPLWIWGIVLTLCTCMFILMILNLANHYGHHWS